MSAHTLHLLDLASWKVVDYLKGMVFNVVSEKVDDVKALKQQEIEMAYLNIKYYCGTLK